MTEARMRDSRDGDQPLDVAAVDGGVTLAAADGEVITLTPEAAAATARRLLLAAGTEAEPEIYQKPLG